ncbi:MAG TPA: phospho-N-acetylmuramoyl-pentapeptide-transferase [Rhodospirillaceae bacterium]|nr:phospho-N-acetylmuramoyl-pentapeptide-transferase [Candidatus Neomarinimicrobiota bacterium]HCX14155.1 phospho-N-acetylmuramoyl-pentapeptide-transferase [Rhodospirillaceae bacterium]
MFYFLSEFSDQIAVLNVFRYLTFRAGGAVVTSLVVAFLFGPAIIRWLRTKQKNGQPIRNDGPQGHLVTKQGTPTMGGVMMLLGIALATLLWADLSNRYIWIALFVTLSYGAIGFLDDYLKVTRRSSGGLKGRTKLLAEISVAAVAAYFVVLAGTPDMAGKLALPFFKNVLIDLGVLYIPFVVFVMVGSGNAVNLTDGLDGLAIVPVMIAASVFTIIAYLIGNVVFANYLQVHYVPGAGELAIFCGSVVGAALGFLWFNAPPAMVFMGDTGSLAMGGALGAVAVVTKHEIVLGIVGGLFVLETVSVIVQVASFKLTGRRIFKMAPLHHHFEEKGWAESTIVIRFWIIAIILAIAGLATLKLR